MDRHNSIALICVYMGSLPYWMPAFLLSCSYNLSIHWFIVTDEDERLLPPCPENVTLLPIKLEQLNSKFTNSLGFDVKIKSDYAYKINDYKVAFGCIFSDELSKFNFWGYCDLDVVWGNIRSFLSEDILGEYDIITSRKNRISGHFCLFRNTTEINKMYEDFPGIIEMMQAEKNYAIDEQYITNYLYMVHQPNWVIRLKYIFRFQRLAKPKVFWHKVLTTSGASQRELGEGTSRCFKWKDGKVYDAVNNELMYIHFHEIKKTMTLIDFGFGDEPNEFRINNDGIFTS